MFREIKKTLLTVYDESEANSLALIVMEEFGGVSLSQDLVGNFPVSDLAKSAIERLLNYEPIQYVTGWTTFCGIRIKCDKRALIPRPETEWMVEQIIKDHPTSVNRIIDLGTGTGCIAIALAKAFPNAEVNGVDISEQALALAQENAENANIKNVHFMKDDINALSINGYFDIIISNPPYITTAEKSQMRKNVLDWEPHKALFVPDEDELLFHRSISKFSDNHLAEGGILVMEINEYLADATRKLTIDGTIINDQFNKPRFIVKHG